MKRTAQFEVPDITVAYDRAAFSSSPNPNPAAPALRRHGGDMGRHGPRRHARRASPATKTWIKPSSGPRQRTICSLTGRCPKNPTVGEPRPPVGLAAYLSRRVRDRQAQFSDGDSNWRWRQRRNVTLTSVRAGSSRRRVRALEAELPAPSARPSPGPVAGDVRLLAVAASGAAGVRARRRLRNGAGTTHHSSHGVLFATGEPCRCSHSSLRLVHSTQRVFPSALLHLTTNRGVVALMQARGMRCGGGKRNIRVGRTFAPATAVAGLGLAVVTGHGRGLGVKGEGAEGDGLDASLRALWAG